MQRRPLLVVPFMLVAVCCLSLVFGFGPEFQVNTNTAGDQETPVIATDPSGGFVVVWAGIDGDGRRFGIVGQRYDPAGNPLGGEFVVNTYTASDQTNPSVTINSNGDFVVVWVSYSQDSSFEGIFGQRFGPTALPDGVEFAVNTYTTDTQSYPSVAMNDQGSFVVVWDSYRGYQASYNVFAQRFDNTGMRQGTEFQVNTYATYFQGEADVVMDDAGDFVVVWESCYQDSSLEAVFARRYDAMGNEFGDEFQVNTYTTDSQFYPAIAQDGAGNFVVVWQSDTQDGSTFGVFGQRFDDSGTALGSEFQVNTYTTNQQRLADVASDKNGSFVVSWQSATQDAPLSEGIFGRRFDPNGAAAGDELQINTYITGNQTGAAVAMDDSGDVVAVWTSEDSQDGSGAGAFGRRFVGTANQPSVAICGGVAHYVWVAFDSPGLNRNIGYRNCVVGGACSPAVRLVGRPTDEFNPEVVCSGNNIIVTWEDTRFGNRDLFIRRSTDGGATFLPSGGLVSASTDERDVNLLMDGTTLIAAWDNLRKGNSHVAMKTSTDSGATFGPIQFVVSAPTAETRPVMAKDGMNLLVAWEDARRGNQHLGYKQSADGGSTFGSIKFLVSSPVDETRPVLGRNGNLLVAAWEDPRRGNLDIFSRRSLDGGNTWGPLFALVSAATEERRPILAMDGNVLLVAWEDRRAVNSHIAYRHSTDGGVSYGPLSFLVSAPTDETEPACDISGQLVACVWSDQRFGQPFPFARDSTDSGAAFFATEPSGIEPLDG